MNQRHHSDDAQILAQIVERTRGVAANRSAKADVHRLTLRMPESAGSEDRETAAESPETGGDTPQTAAIRFLHNAVSTREGGKAPRVTRPDLARLLDGRGLFLGMVVIPLLLVAVYLFGVATPLYEARAVISITKPTASETGAEAGLLGGLDNPSGLEDVFRADTFIKSQTLMDSLEADVAFVTELSGPTIDPVRRLRSMPMLSLSLHDRFDRFVDSWIDLQSGLLTVYVRAPTPGRAIEVSEAVLARTEAQVLMLGEALFETRESYAADMRAAAERQVQAAQSRLVELQFRHQEVDPRNRVEAIYAQITELEDEAQRLNNEIQKAEIEGYGNSPQTQRLVALEAHLRDEIARERTRLVTPVGESGVPLNNILMEYEMAVLDLELAREAVKSAIEAQAQAGRQAALNRSVFQVVVPPTTAATAIYPKAPGVLLLCLVICLTAYVLVLGVRKTTR